MSRFKWCLDCHIPLIQSKCGNSRTIPHKVVDFISRVKPVGKKEYQMYKALFINNSDAESEYTIDDESKKDRAKRFPKILYRSRNLLYSEMSEGTPHFKILLQGKYDIETWGLTNRSIILHDIKNYFKRSKCKEINGYFWTDPEYQKKLIEGNKERLEKLEKRAIKFINWVYDKKKDFRTFVSFSGGKDSAVTAYLVNKALRNSLGSVPLLFSNTDIEYQETVDYVREFNLGKVIEVKSKNKFLDLCNKLGPPSRTMRWCCSTQKASPVNQYYSTINTEILSFDGIRREESNLRAEYPRHHQNTKLQRQYSAYPILDWSEIEVWLFTLWRNIPLNPLYDEGFARIGCWACPNNGLFDTFLFEKIKPKMADYWFKKLRTFSESISNEHDHTYEHDWIYQGKWKGRRVKYHNELIGEISQQDLSFENFDIVDPAGTISKMDEFNDESLFENESKPCSQTSVMVVSLDRPLKEDSFEFLKVFGDSKRILIGNQTLVKIEGQKYSIQYVENSNKIKYRILEKEKNERKILRSRLIRQINKSFNCIKCASCVGLCPKGAITVIDNRYEVDSSKCINCLECTSSNLLSMGCVALHYKPDRLLVDRNVTKASLKVKHSSKMGTESQLLTT